ncbi:MAG: hypothetical protein K5696_11765, partial [Lachnospiraceae bacterium]|nr:hypothetical protein [Lachnospiraceae bacterium]
MKEIEGIREVIDRDGGRITQDLVLLMKNLEKIYSGLDEEQKGSFCEELEHVLEESSGGQKLLFCTFLCVLTLDRKYLHLTQEIVLTDPSLTVENCYYLYQRLMRILFIHSELADHDAILNQWKILRDVVDSYAYALENDLGQDLSYIPRNNRNKGFIIVLIGQFLAASHAPSGIALDRCRILQKRLNKRVMLINVADTLTPVGAVPTWMGGVGSYIPQYSSMDSI